MTALSVSQSKKKLVSWIEEMQDKDLLNRLVRFKNEVELQESENYMLAGKPLTIDELKKRAIMAREAILSGDYITDEELTMEMKTW